MNTKKKTMDSVTWEKTNNTTLLINTIKQNYNCFMFFNVDRPTLIIKWLDRENKYRITIHSGVVFKITMFNNDIEICWFYVNIENINVYEGVYTNTTNVQVNNEIKKIIYLLI